MAEADRHIEEEMEEERKKADILAKARQERLEEFQRNYRDGLDQQRVEQDALRLIEFEQREQELGVSTSKSYGIHLLKIFLSKNSDSARN